MFGSVAVDRCHANAVGIIHRPHVRVHLAISDLWPKMFLAEGTKAAELLRERREKNHSVGLALEVLSTSTREVRRDEPCEELRARVVCQACGAYRMAWDEGEQPPKRDTYFPPCGDGKCVCGLVGPGAARAAGQRRKMI